MKKHHILLLLTIVGIAAMFLNQARNQNNREASTSAELAMLRAAVKKSSEASTTHAEQDSGSRTPAIDVTKFITDFTALLKAAPENTSKTKAAFQSEYEEQLNRAPLSKLKEICALLEKNFPFDQNNTDTYMTWLHVVGLAAKYDPAWAFAKFAKAPSTSDSKVPSALQTFKHWMSQSGESMTPSFADALQKWLDTAQSEGRIEKSDPLVAELRTGIAAAHGNTSEAIKQISLLPYMSQKKAAIEYVAGLQTPQDQQKTLKEFSKTLDGQNFPDFVIELANKNGFEAVREILDSASLSPEKHDLAAASIAAANIDSETNSRAAWLLENLKTDGHRALEDFTETWTEKNYVDAAKWISSLQPGPKRDAALKGFIPTAARIDGATSMDWALTVSDPLLRNQMYSGSYVKWAEVDPDQAKIYHDAHPLDRAALDASSK
jgi:hypothetical protein